MKQPFTLKLSSHSVAEAIVDGLLRIEVSYQIQSYDGSEPPALHFSIECAFSVDYVIQDSSYEPVPESISAFKDGNAIFNTWPYAREFVQNMCSRMAVMPPPLPFLRIVPKPVAIVSDAPRLATRRSKRIESPGKAIEVNEK